MTNIRNVAIIAHVDHGKTTLVDALLRQSKTKLSKEENNSQNLIMDSNELERERGITIFSKNASVVWKDTKINIIDTPGHADFGGEVERVLKMADGCLLLVDAKEGPMPQTRFVLKRALQMKLKVIVVVNKIDKPDARINYVLDKTFDLFLELGADEESAYFPVIYASAKNGLAGEKPDINLMKNIDYVFESIISLIPAPRGNPENPLQVLITNFFGDNFKGRIATGKVIEGTIKANQEVMLINRNGDQKKYKISSLMSFDGIERVNIPEAKAGDIIAVSGISDVNIGETLADVTNPVALPLLDIEEPTVKMTFSVNESPFAGREGEFSTSRQIRERLMKELESDVALKISDNPDGSWEVCGRGELHLAILIERMRREGYEFQVSKPQAIMKEINGKLMTPYEKVFIEVPEIYTGNVIQNLGGRNGEMRDMKTENGITFLEFIIPTRGLFGYRSEFATETHGLGIMNYSFLDYRPDPQKWKDKEKGSLVVHESGQTSSYGLSNAEERGILFIGPGVEVYKGQVIGQNSRPEDLAVNVCKGKQLTNMRSSGNDEMIQLKVPKILTLEESLEYISDDELVEVTPKNIRIRKKVLDKKEARAKAQGIK
ncbi:MAG: translational GTPase TypA [Patescibacteria group bacterium]